MKRLIKRYVLKAQVDRESDEVNEGKNSLFIKRDTLTVSLFAQCTRVSDVRFDSFQGIGSYELIHGN